jgi:hypothetical protein
MRDSGKERGILVEGGEKGAGQPHLLPRLQVRPRLQVPSVQQVAPGPDYVQQHVLHIRKSRKKFSVTDPGCLSRIQDVYPGSRIRLFSIPDPGSSSKNLSILTPKKQKNGF